MLNVFLVFFGGGSGAVARYLLGTAISRQTAPGTFPWHTLTINLLGALLIGAVMETLALRASLPEGTRLLLVVGVLGGFTTFSAFSLECSLMIERGDYMSAAAYIGASVIGTILLVFAGSAAVRAIL
jgi:CrcB protein